MPTFASRGDAPGEPDAASEGENGAPLFRLAQFSFLVFLFFVPLMRLGTVAFGFYAIAADAVYVITIVLSGLALLAGHARLRWHRFYWLLLFYFAALALSAAFSPDPRLGLIKLVTQAYLLSIPILAFNLLKTERDLVRAVLTWIAVTALIAAQGIAVFILFYMDRENILVRNSLFHFGSLPPGNYPRMSLTFGNANMLCNYLTVSTVMVVLGWKLKLIPNLVFWPLLGGTFFAAAFTMSPGLGGIALLLAMLAWTQWSGARPPYAWSAAGAGAVVAALFILAAAIAPAPHPTAPFTMHFPLVGTVWPAGRLMLWLGSLQTFLANPWLGAGLGQHSAEVSLLDPSGRLQFLTDAHNSYLNVAAQAGIPGLVAIIALTFWIIRRTLSFRGGGVADLLGKGFGIAFVSAFVYEGLTGSFEDARHLWLLIGLFLVADRLAVRHQLQPNP